MFKINPNLFKMFLHDNKFVSLHFQNISSESHFIAATHQVEIHCSQEEEGEKETNSSPSLPSSSQQQRQQQLSVVLVAVASEDSGMIYTAPLLSDNTQTNLLWTPLSFSNFPSTKISR